MKLSNDSTEVWMGLSGLRWTRHKRGPGKRPGPYTANKSVISAGISESVSSRWRLQSSGTHERPWGICLWKSSLFLVFWGCHQDHNQGLKWASAAGAYFSFLGRPWFNPWHHNTSAHSVDQARESLTWALPFQAHLVIDGIQLLAALAALSPGNSGCWGRWGPEALPVKEETVSYIESSPWMGEFENISLGNKRNGSVAKNTSSSNMR